jgi:hypothetical protein
MEMTHASPTTRRNGASCAKSRWSCFRGLRKVSPLMFMLYSNEEGRPHVRALIWRDDYRTYATSLVAWARRVNNSAGPLIDEDFKRLSGWGDWHRVFSEEAYPPGAALDEEAFDEDTAEAAVDVVCALVEQLRPYVEAA